MLMGRWGHLGPPALLEEMETDAVILESDQVLTHTLGPRTSIPGVH